ncbi:MAG: hypothetical protein FD143_3168 [Ignavibacteria bacterium]|nr:MAG: hypothetical protein FD143_3168 [Ignavibacteria bacterium]
MIFTSISIHAYLLNMENSNDTTDFIIQTIVTDADSSNSPLEISSHKQFNLMRTIKANANLLKYLFLIALFCIILIVLAYNLLVPKEKEISDEELTRIYKLLTDAFGLSIIEMNSKENGSQKSTRKTFQKIG